MQKVDFIKMHGLGNDFVIIDKRSNNIAITEDIIKRLSDRRTGAGCDQLITINNTNNQSCLLYTSPSPRDQRGSRMPSSA